ncbi:MAG: hypothetical protein ACJ8H8_01855, partial [Geminicoccaceae bacterium]
DVLFASATEPHAWMLYSSMRPSSGTTIALWRPDQSLVASKAGPRRLDRRVQRQQVRLSGLRHACSPIKDFYQGVIA